MIHTQLITTLNNHHKKKTKTDPDGLCQGKKINWSTFKNNEQATALKEYQIKFYKNKKGGYELFRKLFTKFKNQFKSPFT